MTAGEPDDNDAFKIALIAAAAPLLGIVVGVAAAGFGWWLHERLWLEFGLLSLGLNAFNLLPIVPLDGGHILNELMFARHPMAEAAFKVIAAAALVALGVKLGSWVLVALAVGILLFLHISYRMARATARLRATEGVRGGELTEEKVARIRQELIAAVPQYAQPRYATKLPGLVSSTWFKINKKFPSSGRTAVLLFGYVAVVLALAVLALAYAVVVRPRVQAMKLDKQALATLHRGDAATAKREFTQALVLEPGDADFLVGRATAEFEQRDYAAALADLDQAEVRGGPTYGVLLVRGRVRSDQGQFSSAADDLERAAKLRPDRAVGYKFLGYAETKLERLEPARRHLDRAVQLDSSDGMTRWYRGYAEDLAGDFKSAANDYAAALGLRPREPYLHYRLALILRRQHASESPAALDAAVSAAQDPWTRAIGDNLAGRSSDDALLARAADEEDPARPWHHCQAFYYLGMTHLLRGDPAAARSRFEAALATNCRLLGEYNLAEGELRRLKP